jgi:short-subunit dehydrogenase
MSALPSRQPPTVLITGASSGIGRAAARQFARSGARLLLVGRSEQALQAAVAECAALGAPGAAGHVADVADYGAVDAARRAAVERYGVIDVWVNCAAVLLFGRFEELPPEAMKRTVDTNLLGYMNGAQIALQQFRKQGDRGTLINVGSVLGVVPEPYATAYVASKFAIGGLTACLRQETREYRDIHVCAVLPPAVDTPIYQHAGNFSGKAVRSIIPVYSPERVARTIVSLAERPRPQVIVSAFGKALALAARLAPGIVERMIGRLAPRLQFEQSAQDPAAGSLFQPHGPHETIGGWRDYWRARRSSLS